MASQQTERMTGGQAMIRSIHAHGVDTIFGLPGVQLDGLFNAMFDMKNQIRVINARHEQGTAYMALGYSMATGDVGAYAVVPGPGILNTTAALSTAYGCNVPVMAITGQIPSDSIGKGWGQLHEIPYQLETMQSLGKYATRIDHPTHAPDKVRELFKHLRTGRPRPVGVEMPMDMMHLKSDVVMGEPLTEYDVPEPDHDLIVEAAKMLGGAKNPLIFTGTGAYDAVEETVALAEMLEAPVSAYQNGRGVMDERHYLGQVWPAANKLWGEADVVLSIGCRLQPERMFWGMDDDLKVIQIDIDPTELNRVMNPDVGIVSDAATALRALLNEVPKHNSKRASRKDELDALKAATHKHIQDGLPLQMEYLKVIREELPEDGIFVDEFTQVSYVGRIGFPVYNPRSMITPGYQGTLGWGYATALGVQVAHPDKKVISLNGDGGFMYTMPEIATAVHHNIPLTAIVFADGAYGNVKRMQKELYDNRVIGSEFTNPDFVKLAESFGAQGLRANNPEELRTALKTGFAHNGPTLIECPVGEFPEPWPFIRPPATRGKHAGQR